MIRAGDKIGPYTLVRRLGRGTFGVVWLAEKRTTLALTKVALKLLNDDDIDLEAVKREAAVWVEASGHPNVLPIIDADIYDEQVVIVSEYAPDGSLSDWLKEHGGRASTIDATVEITLGILDGLAHLHARRIIHRDLKPANILLQGKTPRLVDFGLARVLKTTSQSSNVSGTYAYMPPEAFDGKRSEQTDVWGAGVILYQMLTGRLPYPQTDDAALIGALLTREPEPPPHDLPLALREVLIHSLQKNPAERYQSVAEMRRVLYDAIHPPAPTAPQAKPESELPTRRISTPPAETIIAAPPTAPSPAVKTSEPERQAVAAFVVIIGLIGAASMGLFSGKKGMTSSKAGNVEVSNMGVAGNTSNVGVDLTHEPPAVRNQIGMELVSVPAGSFMMGSENGSSDEKLVHQVTIRKGFYMGKYEVTQAQWQQVMKGNPSNFKNCQQCPIENVSWDDAQGFIRKLNAMNDGYVYRLPTEAEWEYACRAGTTGDYAGGLDAMAWYYENSGNMTHPVGQKQPNAFGLYDMLGNVWEWCEDWYHDSYNGAPTDGSAWESGGERKQRVLRGGSWIDIATYLRSAYRFRNDPGNRTAAFVWSRFRGLRSLCTFARARP